MQPCLLIIIHRFIIYTQTPNSSEVPWPGHIHRRFTLKPEYYGLYSFCMQFELLFSMPKLLEYSHDDYQTFLRLKYAVFFFTK